jgi:hypothetical protein
MFLNTRYMTRLVHGGGGTKHPSLDRPLRLWTPSLPQLRRPCAPHSGAHLSDRSHKHAPLDQPLPPWTS